MELGCENSAMNGNLEEEIFMRGTKDFREDVIGANEVVALKYGLVQSCAEPGESFVQTGNCISDFLQVTC
jgi:hypothetical protein